MKHNGPLDNHANAASTPAERIDYLDSIRGIASLYVMLVHIPLDFSRAHVHPVMKGLLAVLDHGKLGVASFIVLSGYCLMLPVARSGEHVLRSSFWEYMTRRARRIYPPYIAAMALSLVMIAAFPATVESRSFWLTTFTPAFGWENITSHLLLAHNLDNAWLYKINAPFWSVATEWQIYFLFPLLLLPVAKRWGVLTTVPVGLLLALLPVYVFRRFETAAPWLISLFAMGMVAATITHSPNRRFHLLRARSGWGVLCFLQFAVFFTFLVVCHGKGWPMTWKLDCAVQVWWGVAVATLLVWLTTNHGRGKSVNAATSFLRHRWLRALGGASYSLYLTHGISVCLASIGLSYFWGNATNSTRIAVALLVGTIASLLFTLVFFHLFEKPFLRKPATTRDAPDSLGGQRVLVTGVVS